MSYSAEPPHSMIKELLCVLGEYVSQGGKIGREVGNLDFAIHGFSFFERFYFRMYEDFITNSSKKSTNMFQVEFISILK